MAPPLTRCWRTVSADRRRRYGLHPAGPGRMMRPWSRTRRQGATTSSSHACGPATRTRSASCSTATTHRCDAWPARYVATDAAADEVVQDTWLGVLRGIDRFEQRSSLKTWIFRILMNIARTRGHARQAQRAVLEPRTRRRRRTPTIAADRFQGPDGRYPGHWAAFPTRWHDHPEVRALGHETLAVVRDALDMLPPAQQEVVRLRDLEGWTSFEVCNALGLTETNQRVLLHRGRAKLRAALEPYFDEAKSA